MDPTDSYGNPPAKPDEPEPAAEEASESAEDEGKEEMSDSELVQYARDCYRIGLDATARWRSAAKEDLNFLAGEQWDPDIKERRDAKSRPALTINRLPQFVSQITNEQRQSKPAVTVSPIDDKGDKQTADVLQGIIRNIEYSSNAEAAYAAGGEAAARTGIGYWDVCAEWESETSFEQKLVIKRIPNPLSVVMDPGTKEVAGDDARWLHISVDLSEGEWKAAYPDIPMPMSTDWQGQFDKIPEWVTEEGGGVRLHEYRYIVDEPDELIELPPGMVKHVPENVFPDMPEGGPEFSELLEPDVAKGLPDFEGEAGPGAALASELPPHIAQHLKESGVRRRKTTKRCAKWVKIVGDDIVDRGEFNGRYLQLVRVMGTELNTGDNEITYEGVIRHAKDPQRVLNFMASAEVEAIALAPKAPWIMEEGQAEGYENMWETSNTESHAYLKYKAKSVGGQPLPPPQRVMAEANVQAITSARMNAAEDMKSVTGIYDASLGNRSNETSGRAILSRQSQSQTGNFHFQDNLAMAIRLTGRILIDLIPKVYSGPRIMRILGEDDEHEMVPVNQPGERDGEPVHIQLDAGRYDVAVSMGPSYHSRREQAAAQLMELIKSYPAIAQFAGDLLVAALDIPGGDAIADRLKKMLPPQIRPPDAKQPPAQVLAQQVEQATQMVQQLTQALHKAHDKLDTQAVEAEAKERMELMKLHVDLIKTAATLENSAHVTSLKAEAALIGKRLDMAYLQPETPQPQPQPSQPQPTNGATPNGPPS